MTKIPDPPEQFRDEGGRMVTGPDLSDVKGQSGFAAGLIIAAVFCLAFAAVGFLGGRLTAPTPTFHQMAEDMAHERSCVPQLDFTVSREPIPDATQDQAALQLKAQGLKNVEVSQVTIAVKSTTYYVGILTWENCAS